MNATKLCVAISLAVVTGSVHASGNEGFSAGLGVGFVQPTVKYSDNLLAGYYKWDKSDVVFNIDAAYTTTMNDRWQLGFGLTYDFSDAEAGKVNLDYGTVEATLKNHYSIYIQPTYVIDDSSAVFAKIGFHSIKVNAIGLDGADWIDDKFSTHGIGYGVGYKRTLSKNLFAQGEAQFVNYDNKSFDDDIDLNWHYKQKTSALILTMGYQF